MIYNYDTNRIYLETADEIVFDLQLRDNITIVDGDSATGKTLLASTILDYQAASRGNNQIDASNILVVNLQNKAERFIGERSDSLIIIDNAKIVLTMDLIRHINSDRSNRYLLFGRGLGLIEASPNHYATLVRSIQNGKITLSLKYSYTVKGWG